MKKNDIVTVEIEDIGVGGEGIGKAEGVTLFIKDALPRRCGDSFRHEAEKDLWLCQTS